MDTLRMHRTTASTPHVYSFLISQSSSSLNEMIKKTEKASTKAASPLVASLIEPLEVYKADGKLNQPLCTLYSISSSAKKMKDSNNNNKPTYLLLLTESKTMLWEQNRTEYYQITLSYLVCVFVCVSRVGTWLKLLLSDFKSIFVFVCLPIKLKDF